MLTDDFKQYIETKGPHAATFKEMAPAYEKTKAGDIYSAGAVKFNNRDARDMGLFGQRLTDFDNGLAFKKLIDALETPIHGYRWSEQNDPDAFSYCLFSSAALSEPVRSKKDFHADQE